MFNFLRDYLLLNVIVDYISDTCIYVMAHIIPGGPKRITVAHGTSRYRHLHTFMCPPKDLYRRHHPFTVLPETNLPLSRSRIRTYKLWMILGSLVCTENTGQIHCTIVQGSILAHNALYDTLWDTEDLVVLSLTRVIRGKMSEIFIAPSKTQ